MNYDLAINNALIIDGTGSAPVLGSVGIQNGTIVNVLHHHDPLTATDVIDVGGNVLSPGFVDLHSHADFSLPTNPEAITQITQGVTTLLTGNCGFSPFPVEDPATLQTATAFLGSDLDWSWRTANGFTAALHHKAPTVSAVLQVGHGALRIATMGTAQRAPTKSELSRMCDLLAEAAEQDIRGFSTGLIYSPGSYAASAEIETLAQVAAEYDLLYSTHMRNESDTVLEAVAEAISVARTTGVRLEISHLKAMGPRNHGKVNQALQLIDEARDDGVDVATDVYPYAASSTTLTSRLPGWALDGGIAALLQRLNDPEQRQHISSALSKRFDGEIDPAGIVLAELPDGPYSGWIGRSLVDIAKALATTAHDGALDVLAAHQASVGIINHAMSDTDVETVLRYPHTAVASDGGILTARGAGSPHPRSFGTFPRVLGHYVRERHLLSLEDAIRKMTSLPASRAGLTDRGRIAGGLAADLTIFDPLAINDRSTYTDPWQMSVGVQHVLIGGRLVLYNGQVIA
ncbi:N-acyl-D-amino-acid deacylase family protein [Arthrobacter castelli]|uniref:N-acyl-D-amino-acid deacylase family protein n=1 Tax=Arthrobacter castelli TaxID=271431 RepID=UPI0004035B1B|nr:D-aminoacylase [Arthrobacter castelli]